MKRGTLTNILLVTLIAAACFLLCMRYAVVPREGYPTWEAVRNFLLRDGQITVTFPDGVIPRAAQCSDPNSSVSIRGQTVIVRIGYSVPIIEVDTEYQGRPGAYSFTPMKVGQWHRMRYEPENPADPASEFWLFVNGVFYIHNDVTAPA